MDDFPKTGARGPYGIGWEDGRRYWEGQCEQRDKEIERLSSESRVKDETLADILKFIDAQAEDEGLWCEAQYASEAYIQRGLRGCHAYIESRIKDGPPASDSLGERMADEYIDAETEHMRGRESTIDDPVQTQQGPDDDVCPHECDLYYKEAYGNHECTDCGEALSPVHAEHAHDCEAMAGKYGAGCTCGAADPGLDPAANRQKHESND